MNAAPVVIESDVALNEASKTVTERLKFPVTEDFIITEGGRYVGMGAVMHLLNFSLPCHQFGDVFVHRVDVCHEFELLLARRARGSVGRRLLLGVLCSRIRLLFVLCGHQACDDNAERAILALPIIEELLIDARIGAKLQRLLMAELVIGRQIGVLRQRVQLHDKTCLHAAHYGDCRASLAFLGVLRFGLRESPYFSKIRHIRELKTAGNAAAADDLAKRWKLDIFRSLRTCRLSQSGRNTF